MPAFKSETDLAAKVVEWLEGFDVYQEVGSSVGRVADIVVDVNGLAWVIECKKSLGLAVLEQASRWKMYGVPRVSVAVPRMKDTQSNTRYFAHEIAKWKGIGIIEVSRNGYVEEHSSPEFTRPRKLYDGYWNLLNECNDQHKTFCDAGSTSGRWTPFKQTEAELERVIRGNPGITMKDAIAQMKEHHYRTDSTAYANLMTWLRRGVLKGIEAKTGKGNALRLYLTDKESTHA